MTLAASRPKRLAGGGPLERRVRHHRDVRQQAIDRIGTLALAANRLACNSLGLCFDAPDTDEAFETLALELRQLMPVVERYELSVLVMPMEGLTYAPDRLMEFIKRVGGFRIGAMPSFAHAAETGSLIQTLRKLAPYSGAIQATVDGFTRAGKHSGYDLVVCVTAIRSVGFINTLAIDYTGNGDAVKHRALHFASCILHYWSRLNGHGLRQAQSQESRQNRRPQRARQLRTRARLARVGHRRHRRGVRGPLPRPAATGVLGPIPSFCPQRFGRRRLRE